MSGICGLEMRIEDFKRVNLRLRPRLRPEHHWGAHIAPPGALAVRTFVALDLRLNKCFRAKIGLLTK